MVRASVRWCGYSQFSARIVIFRANTVVVCANMVFLLVKLFLYILDLGDLQLLMMIKGYILAQIDQLIWFPEYSQVLQMDPPEYKTCLPKGG